LHDICSSHYGKLRSFDSRVLRKIFKPKKEEEDDKKTA
jgi:uncharacterized protein (UPF0335 family)